MMLLITEKADSVYGPP